jgi:hypothetical protein
VAVRYPAPTTYTHYVCDIEGVGQVYIPKTIKREKLDELLRKVGEEWALGLVEDIR